MQTSKFTDVTEGRQHRLGKKLPHRKPQLFLVPEQIAVSSEFWLVCQANLAWIAPAWRDQFYLAIQIHWQAKRVRKRAEAAISLGKVIPRDLS